MVKTNKTVIRKRRPGGGRKPKGAIHSKSEVFTTRITAETREAIEREAERSGQSISQVAERLLMFALEMRRRRQNFRSLRALTYLIEQLGKSVGGSQWADLEEFGSKSPDHRKAVEKLHDEWRTDPFLYKAFSIAVQSLFDALKPAGVMKPPFSAEALNEAIASFGDTNPAFISLMRNAYASPENLAAYKFANLWSQLNRQHPLSERELEQMRGGEIVGEMMREEFYGLRDARDDLKLTREDEK